MSKNVKVNAAQGNGEAAPEAQGAPANLFNLFGYSNVAAIRRLGKEGWGFRDIRDVFNALGGEVEACADATIRTQRYCGVHGVPAERDEAGKVTKKANKFWRGAEAAWNKKQQAEFNKLRKELQAAKAKAAEEAEAQAAEAAEQEAPAEEATAELEPAAA